MKSLSQTAMTATTFNSLKFFSASESGQAENFIQSYKYQFSKSQFTKITIGSFFYQRFNPQFYSKTIRQKNYQICSFCWMTDGAKNAINFDISPYSNLMISIGVGLSSSLKPESSVVL